MAYEDELPI